MRRVGAVVVLVIAAVAASMTPVGAMSSVPALRFVGGRLPQPAGVFTMEPGVGVDGAGNFWMMAQGYNPALETPATGGVSQLWRSTDDGHAYKHVRLPVDV